LFAAYDHFDVNFAIVIKRILEKAVSYQEFAATKANAYYATAHYYRSNHMRLGIVATIVSALVGTALFAGLATQFQADGKQTSLNLHGWTILGFCLVALLSISAPVLTGLQTFLKYSEQAESHRATAIGYDGLRQRLDLFRLTFEDAPDSEQANALKEFGSIIEEFESVAKNSPTIPDRVYDTALLRRRGFGAGAKFVRREKPEEL
jgi:hypothetical protein